ncbi:hypothetical protein [Nocardioides gilvus]|uniref:hypothetical protein n=1 Tax=Nocardioides gilvus TaxID=1735589 RepID=UPI0013A53DFE|nr:hypothetical protein [Nocardioides gilvus]
MTPFGLTLTIVLETAAVFAAWWFGPGTHSADAAVAGVIWQVHAAFASIGFAGLAIAFQVLGEPPLSAGSARHAVVTDMRFGSLLVSGVTASLVLGIVALWLASPSTILVSFVPVLTLSMLIVGAAYARLAVLFTSTQRVERLTLTELKARVSKAATKAATQEVSDLATERLIDSERGLVSGSLPSASGLGVRRVRNPHHRAAVVRLNVGPMVHAADYLAWAAHEGSSENGSATYDYRQRISVLARPRRQYRPGDVLFEMHDWPGVDDDVWKAITRQLLSGLTFTDDQSGDAAVVFAEDMSALQDSVLAAVQGHQIARVRRGYEYYHETIHEARAATGSTHLGLKDPRWFERQISEIDVAAVESSGRMAFVAIADAERMAFDAVKTEDLTWLRLALDRLERIWALLLKAERPDALHARENVLVSMQNLAEFAIPFSFSGPDQSAFASRQLVWCFTSIAKKAIAVSDIATAHRVIGYMGGLYDTSPRLRAEQRGVEVAAGQAAVLAWVLFSRDKDPRDPPLELSLDSFPRRHYLPDMVLVLRAYETYRDEAPWRHWETEKALPFRTYTLEFERYFREAVLLLTADGKLRLNAASVDPDDRYLIKDMRATAEVAQVHWPVDRPDDASIARVSAKLGELLVRMKQQSNDLLATTPLSVRYIAEFHESIVETLISAPGLASFLELPSLTGPPSDHGLLGHILHGIPKDYFVENDVIASPANLGHEIGAAVLRGQDIGVLRVLTMGQTPSEVAADELRETLDQVARTFIDPVIVYNGQPEVEEDLSLGFKEDGKATLAGYEAFALYVGDSAFPGDFLVIDRQTVPAFEFLPEENASLTKLPEAGLAVGIREDGQNAEGHPILTIEYGQLGQWELRPAQVFQVTILR